MSRSELAEEVCRWLWETTGNRYDLDGHYVAKLERGVVRRPSAAYRAGFRHVLKAPTDEELGFTGRSTARAPVVRQVDSMAGSPQGSAELEEAMVDAGDESTTFLSFAEASNVGDLTVEQMHADAYRIAREYLKVPTQPLFVRTRSLRDRAFGLLAGHQHPNQTRELYTVAGWSLTLLAWMTVDLGRPDIAESHARAAWACAENADHNGLRAWVRATQHTAAFWQDDFRRAGDYALDGLQYASGSASLFLSSAWALDLARQGRIDDAREALGRSQTVGSTPSPTEELGGPFSCSPDRAEGLWSDAHLSMGEPTVTLEHARRGVEIFESAPADDRNHGSERMVRLQLVKASVALGELDSAADSLASVLATSPEHRVRPLLHRVTEVAGMLSESSRASESVAQAMRDGIGQFTRRPAVGG